MGRSGPEWVEQLRSGSPDARRKAASVLGWLGEEAVGPLVAALSDSEPKVQRAAAQALGEIGEPAAEAVLEAFLGAPADRAGPRAALARLGRKGAPAVLARVAADEGAPATAREAFESLGRDAWVSLFDALRSRTPALRAFAVDLIQRTGRDLVPAALARLEDGPDDAALEVLRQLGRRALPALLRASEGAEGAIAIWCLPELEPRPADVLSTLRHALRRPELAPRLAALRVLGALGAEAISAAGPELARAARDASNLLRFLAIALALRAGAWPEALLGQERAFARAEDLSSRLARLGPCTRAEPSVDQLRAAAAALWPLSSAEREGLRLEWERCLPGLAIRAVAELEALLDEAEALPLEVLARAGQAQPRALAEALVDIPDDPEGRLTALCQRLSEPLFAAVASLDKAPGRAFQGALAKALGERGLSLLTSELQASDARARSRAIRALAGVSGATSALITALEDEDPGVRREAAQALATQAPRALPEATVSALEEALGDRSARVRRAAARTLVRFGGRGRRALERALRDTDRGARQAAIYGLGRVDVSGAALTAALAGTLSDPRWFIRRTALKALGSQGPAASAHVPLLVELLEVRDARVRFAAAEALAQIAPERAVEAVSLFIEALENPSLRESARKSLESVGPRAVGPLLASLEDDPARGPLVSNALRALAVHAGMLDESSAALEPASWPAPAIEALRRRAREGSSELRALACALLAEAGGRARAAAPELIASLSGPEELREAATLALASLGRAALEPLKSALKTGDPALRPDLVRALGRLRARPEEVASALYERLCDPLVDAHEAAEVERALAGIAPRLDPAEAIDTAASVLGVASPRARRVLLSALASLPGPAAVEPVLRAFEEHPERRAELYELACRLGDGAWDGFVEALRSGRRRGFAAVVLGLRDAPWVTVEAPAPKRLDRPMRRAVTRALLDALEAEPQQEWILDGLVRLGSSAAIALLAAAQASESQAATGAALVLAEVAPGLAGAVLPRLAALLRASESAMTRRAVRVIRGLAQGGAEEDEATAGLIEALAGSTSAEARARAMGILGGSAPTTTPLLLGGLTDSAAAVRRAAVWACGERIGRGERLPLEPLIQSLRDPDSDVRARAAATLGQLRDAAPAVAPALVAGLADSDAAASRAAASALAELRPAALGALLPALERGGAQSRRWAAWSLGRMHERSPLTGDERERVARAFQRALRSEDASVAQSAAWGLARLGLIGRLALPQLRDALGHAHAGVRWFATHALAELGGCDAATTEVLLRALDDDEPDVRCEAAFALVERSTQGDDRILAVLLEALASQVAGRDSSFRRRALSALETLGRGAVPALFEALRDRATSAGAGAAIVLARISPLAVHAVLPVLIKALSEAAPELRPEVARALGALKDEALSAAPALLEAQRSEDPELRSAALRALSELGDDPIELAEACQRGLADISATVRESAARAVERSAQRWDRRRRGELSRALARRLDDEAGVQRAAVDALAALGEPAVAALVERLGGPDPVAPSAASRALTTLGAPALPALLRALASPARWARLRAAEVIVEVWPLSLNAIPDMLDALAGDDEWSRQNAIRVIEATARRLAAEDASPAPEPDAPRAPKPRLPRRQMSGTYVLDDPDDDSDESLS